jgi:hypothetical protein
LRYSVSPKRVLVNAMRCGRDRTQGRTCENDLDE